MGRPGRPGASGSPPGVRTGPRAGLRAGLRGLTPRGRAFLTAGLTAVACSYALGQGPLLPVGVLLTALPLASAALLGRARYRVAGRRRLVPPRIAAREEARVHLRVDNLSRSPTGLLLLEDRVPEAFGTGPRFVLDRVEGGGRREVSYRVRCDLRGRYRLGPLGLRLSDPFGLCELGRSFAAADVLTVLPRVDPLPPVRATDRAAGPGDGGTRSLALAGEDDVVPRGYRQGDDVRRVHWKSTARHGELMVRREERPQRRGATVLLDTRGDAHRGTGPDSSFEWAVGAAASVAVHLVRRGWAVRLLTDTGTTVPDGAGGVSAPGAAALLLDALAVTDRSPAGRLSRAEEAVRSGGEAVRSGGEALLVAVLGGLDEEEAYRLVRLRGRVGTAIAVLLDVESWAGPRRPGGAAAVPGGDPDARARTLRAGGWTVLAAAAGTALAELWPQADRPPGTGPVTGADDGGTAPGATGATGQGGAGRDGTAPQGGEPSGAPDGAARPGGPPAPAGTSGPAVPAGAGEGAA